MRELEFRGKKIHTKEWVYGYYLQMGEEHWIMVKPGMYFVIDPKTLGQYIGRTDNKNKKLYENDIVNIKHPQDLTGDFTNTHGRVFWWDEQAAFYHGHESPKNGCGRPPKRMWKYVTKIGNVFDNPELMEK